MTLTFLKVKLKTMKKINQTSIAKDTGISLPFLSMVLSGKKRPSWPVSQRLESATGIPAVLWIDGQVDREYLRKNYRPGKEDQKAGRASNEYQGKEIVNG